MPRDIETFTTCAGPGTARPHTKLGGVAGFIISAWYFSGVLTIVGGLAFLAGIILLAGPLGWCATGALVIVALVEIKGWYYNERLLCIRDRDCAVGTVISEPTAAFDGDRKLNLMLAPFSQLEIELALLSHLDRNRTMLTTDANFPGPFHTAAPSMPTMAELSASRTIFKDYMKALKGSDPDDSDATSNMYNQITIGLVDTLLLPTNVDSAGAPKNFYNRYYRKDATQITDADTFDAIPSDFDASVAWQGTDAKSDAESVNPVSGGTEKLNPMFRFDDNPMVPYLHCEVEGNYVAILLDDFITALTAFTIGCMVFGPLIGLALGVLAWLLKKLIDWISGNDGDAAEPDVDWDDPDFTGFPDVTEASGDVVAVYGNWIMDTEHHQYFEIHPVRAYYVIARNELGRDEPVLVDGNEDQVIVGANFDPTRVDGQLADAMCDRITRVEEETPPERIQRNAPTALSYGMTTKYAGGGANRVIR